jgi:RND family efflux transporter MFP subunit
MRRVMAYSKRWAAAVVLPMLMGATPLMVSAQGNGQQAVVQIQAALVGQVAMYPVRSAFAEVVSLNESRISVEASGVVRQWHADVGSHVAAGELLLSLDDRDATFTLAQAQALTAAAKARLELSEVQLQRAKDLVKTGFVTQEAFSVRQTELALAKAELASLQAQESLAARQLEKMQIHAPFAGVILERHAQVGEKLPLGTLAFVLIDPIAIEVQAQLSFDQIESLQLAKSIEFTISGTTYPLSLLRVSPVASMPARTQVVRLGLQGQQRPPAGATGQLRWQQSQATLAPAVLVRRQAEIGVFRLIPAAGGYRAQFVALPQAQEGREALVVGLSMDDLMVVQGQDTLQDDQVLSAERVRIRPASSGM